MDHNDIAWLIAGSSLVATTIVICAAVLLYGHWPRR